MCVTNIMHMGLRGKVPAKSYAEIIGLCNNTEDERTGDEIARDVIKKAGLEVSDDILRTDGNTGSGCQ